MSGHRSKGEAHQLRAALQAELGAVQQQGLGAGFLALQTFGDQAQNALLQVFRQSQEFLLPLTRQLLPGLKAPIYSGKPGFFQLMQGEAQAAPGLSSRLARQQNQAGRGNVALAAKLKLQARQLELRAETSLQVFKQALRQLPIVVQPLAAPGVFVPAKVLQTQGAGKLEAAVDA